MCKRIKSNLILAFIVFFIVNIVFGVFAYEKISYAAMRCSDVLTEDFLDEELSYKKWVHQGINDNNKIYAISEGNGTFQFEFSERGSMLATFYYDKYISVEEDQDLVIEYDVVDFCAKTGRIGRNSLMLVKGMGSEETKPAETTDGDADAKLEGISYFTEGTKIYTAVGYALRSGVTSYAHNPNQISVSDTSRGDEVKNYYQSLYTPVYDGSTLIGYDVPYGYDNVAVNTESGLTPVKARSWCGDGFGSYLKQSNSNVAPYYFTTQEEIDAYSIYHIFEKGYTFKHVYKSTGGYVCYVKPIGKDDTDYAVFAELSDELPGTSVKRFGNRSGYVGFNAYGDGVSVSFDDFKIYTSTNESESRGTAVHEFVSADFEKKDGERYGSGSNGAHDWNTTVAGAFKQSVSYEKMGYKFDNPSEGNYIYSGSSYKLKYDGNYDEYVVVDARFSIEELTFGKDFGFLFGGSSIDHLLEHNGNVFVYLTRKQGNDNYFIGVDIVNQQSRNPIGPLKNSGIPIADIDNIDKIYKLSIVAMRDGSIVLSVFNENGEKIAGEFTFGGENKRVILKNRFAIISVDNEYASLYENISAVFVMKYFNVFNKYYYSVSGFNGKDVSEDFESVNDDGSLKSDDIEIFEDGLSEYVPNAGIFVENGVLKLRGIGHKSGIAAQYSYNSFVLTFDIVDMQREPEYGANGSVVVPVSSAPIIISFGCRSADVSSSGNSLIIRNPLVVKNDNGDVIERFDGSGGESTRIQQAVADTENVSTIAFAHNKKYDDFGKLRQNILDPSLSGKTIRIRIEFSPEGVLSFGYCVLGLEDESMLDNPIYSIYYEGGEGCINISSTHSLTSALNCNIAIDNFTIKDTDTISEREEDDEDGESDGGNIEPQKNENWVIYMAIGGGGVAVMAAVVSAIILVKKRKRK